MTSKHLLLICSIVLCIISCKKNSDTQAAPDDVAFFKLKSIKFTGMHLSYPWASGHIDIKSDASNNKIILSTYENAYHDTTIRTFTYNDKNQLTLYECTDNLPAFYISRMEFVRNTNGEVTKVLSEYKNGLIASSEGICRYDKKGDTTLITYIDSTLKHPRGWTDAKDAYTIALVNNRITYSTTYSKSGSGKIDTATSKYVYDGPGLVTISSVGNSIVRQYQRGSETATELQKFIARLGGDLFWFYRAGQLSFQNDYVGYTYNFLGTVLQKLTITGNGYITYINEFDSNGNLKKLSAFNQYGDTLGIQEYEYLP